MRGDTGPRPFRPMRVVRRRGVVRSDAVRNARAVPSQTATQNFEQLIILDPGSCYPRVLSTDNGSTPYDYLFMIFMSSDGAGLIAHAYHAYHASATPEELCLEAWTVDRGFWLDKIIAPRQGRRPCAPIPPARHRRQDRRAPILPARRRRDDRRLEISQKRFNTPRRRKREDREA